ncbi:hypothetical protein EHF33_14330 [Deinococcus psychrotolerans]|uniref:Uncharacterized protein n=1 Tax=Deinococcus psychrotolerans TaxID=2489213 RepID=A0A3G8YFH8_9DEIO|nr:hypothetical protein [Deinococcus psychrotolerans]AZI44089.1 hypothetical protein EHF33_14330 [Deinococcus psychrotolerans]
MSLKQLVLAGALLLGIAQAQFASTLDPSAQELLQRVTGGGQEGPVVQLGGAPADLLKALPPGSRVIGTVTYPGLPGRGPGGNTTVYFDSSLPPGQVVKSFAATLGPTWKQATGTLSPYEAQGGFQQSAQITQTTFYRTTPPQILRVSTQVVGAVTQVSLSRQEDENVKQTIPYLAAPPPLPPGFLTLPKLSAPKGSTVNLSGTGNSSDGITQNARIETKLSRQEVINHYAAQLRQAGWTLVTQANVSTASSSIWTFKQDGRDRLGILIIAGTSPYSGTLISQGTR